MGLGCPRGREQGRRAGPCLEALAAGALGGEAPFWWASNPGRAGLHPHSRGRSERKPAIACGGRGVRRVPSPPALGAGGRWRLALRDGCGSSPRLPLLQGPLGNLGFPGPQQSRVGVAQPGTLRGRPSPGLGRGSEPPAAPQEMLPSCAAALEGPGRPSWRGCTDRAPALSPMLPPHGAADRRDEQSAGGPHPPCPRARGSRTPHRHGGASCWPPPQSSHQLQPPVADTHPGPLAAFCPNKDVASFNHQIKCLSPPSSSRLSHSTTSFSRPVARKKKERKKKNSLIFINRESHLLPVTIFDLSK